MEIKDLMQAMHQFVEAKGWYAEGSIHPQTPRNIAISLCLESAEVLDHFQWSEQAVDKQALEGELADVALYLFQLAHLNNVDLEKAILNKLAINYQREWRSNS